MIAFALVIVFLVLFLLVKWPSRKPKVRRGISMSARGSVHITSNAEGTWIEAGEGHGYAVIDGQEITLAPNEKRFIPRRSRP